MKISVSRTLLSLGAMAVGASLMASVAPILVGIGALLALGGAFMLMNEADSNLRNHTIDSDITFDIKANQKQKEPLSLTIERDTDHTALTKYRDQIDRERANAKFEAKSL